MAQNFVQCGDILDWTNGGTAVTSGTPVLMGALVGIALVDIGAGATGAVQTEGVFTVPKATGAAWAFGDSLYWDNTNKYFTKTSSGNTFAGHATAAALSGDATGNIRLYS